MNLEVVDVLHRSGTGGPRPSEPVVPSPWAGDPGVTPLRIAVIAPPWFEIPPAAYGGIESVCHLLVEGLVDQGHDVTLIASGPNRTRARMRTTFPEPPSGLGQPAGHLVDMVHAARAANILEDLSPDVIHDHSAAGPLSARARRSPTVVTAHGPVDGMAGDLYRSLAGGISLVAISEAQRLSAPELPWVATVHNAIPVDDYPLRTVKEEFALFLGRMSPDKGVHLAIDAARASGIPIIIAGKCGEPDERDYFEREIRPRLGPGVEWIGEADTTTKKDLYARARCLVCPIQWEEPFGLVMIEAMACGTPVVALRRGSVPEVVVDGVTGFICDRPDQLGEAIKRSDVLDPLECRQHVVANFASERMVRGYERVYARIARASTSRR